MQLITKSCFWKYYWDVTVYNLIFSLAVAIFHSWLWAFIVFGSYGIVIGLLAFGFLKNNEYYLYYNLGLTKRKLATSVLLINLMITAPIFIFVFISSF